MIRILLFISILAFAVAFAPISPASDTRLSFLSDVAEKTRSSSLFAGGFGGGGGGSKKKGKKKKAMDKKLKPKLQWDRYSNMKGEDKIAVAVRCKEDESDDWLFVGYTKSKGGEYTEISVAKQRALIAEHAIRLYPLQVSTKKTIEWAYSMDVEGGDWVVVDKSILDEASIPDGIEKLIGFEGKGDPASGFYCVYDMGKVKDMQA